MSFKKRGLGRDLEALLGNVKKVTAAPVATETHLEGELRQLSLEKIQAGKYQPRKDFSEDALQELANSIKAQGIIQPIVVRTIAPNKFEIVAGERRFRAAKIAELTQIPALIRELPDEAAIALALIENIQREDLNSIEEAQSLHRLSEEFSLTHEQVANAVGKSRVTVTNLIRLLALSDKVKNMLIQKQIEMGHARALLSLSQEQQNQIAEHIYQNNFSVRQTEDYIRKVAQKTTLKTINNQHGDNPEILFDKQRRLVNFFELPVLVQQNAKGKGKIIIRYKDEKELAKILEKLESK